MSDFVLDYDILEGIAKSSNSLGRHADEYADRLTGKVANAITNVTGSSSGYLEDAGYYVNQKIAQLQRKAQEFYSFAEQITVLSETAARVDEEVQKLLRENQREFLSHHESLRIDDWKADILNWLVDLRNKLPILDFLGDILSSLDTLLESFINSIKYWYYCEGGKYIVEYIGSTIVAVFVVTLFVVSLPAVAAAAAAASAVGTVVLICGVIGAGIGTINEITNSVTSLRAAYEACNGDPAWARIYSRQDTLSQVLRETNFHNGTLNNLSYMEADTIDRIEITCLVVGVADIGFSLSKLIRNSSIFNRGLSKLGDFTQSIKRNFTELKVNVKNIFGKADDVENIANLNKADDIAVNRVGGKTLEGGSETNKLDWDSVVSKKGETRVDHINKHGVDNLGRDTHTVFNDDPITTTNKAWENKGNTSPKDDGMGGEIYNIPYKNAGYEGGTKRSGDTLDYVTIVVEKGTNNIITAFPSNGEYGIK